jgi:hypothetical protein
MFEKWAVMKMHHNVMNSLREATFIVRAHLEDDLWLHNCSEARRYGVEERTGTYLATIASLQSSIWMTNHIFFYSSRKGHGNNFHIIPHTSHIPINRVPKTLLANPRDTFGDRIAYELSDSQRRVWI